MRKPTLLYASPFWPKKSGISEYSESLITGLDKFFELTLLTDNYILDNKDIRDKYHIVKYNASEKYEKYDYIIYNFGNNPDYHCYMYDMIQNNPGYVILHDYILYYLTVGYYLEKDKLFQKVYELEGIRGIQIVKDSLQKHESRNLLHHKEIAAMLPMNWEVINKAKGIFVHSQYGENIVKENYKDAKTYKINLVKCETMELKDINFIHKHFKINDNEYIVGAVGFIAETKQNELTCLAIKKYNETNKDKIHYVMIGEGNYVDHLLDDYIHKTGFLTNTEFFQAINSCNLIMNLRYPYHGESSATLIQCMDMNKPCVVSDIGWFSELKDDTVIKLPTELSVNELCEHIQNLRDKDLTEIIANAKSYVENYCLPEKVAQSIYENISLNV